MKTKILFRCDQNEYSGFGHFSRCLNMARHMISDNYSVTFYGNYSEFAKSLFDNYHVSYITTSDKYFSDEDLSCYGDYEFAFVDSYFLNQELLDKIISTGVKVVLFDDQGELSYENVHLVVNFRADADKLFSYNCKNEALGTSYFVPKPEFLPLREKYVVAEEVNNVLIFLGGNETTEENYLHIVRDIKEYLPDCAISIITQYALAKLTTHNVNLIKPHFNIEEYYCNHDVVITGGGLSKYECAFLGIPAGSFHHSQLQYNDTEVLKRHELISDLGMLKDINDRRYLRELKKLVSDAQYRFSLSQAGINFFPEGSYSRLVSKIN